MSRGPLASLNLARRPGEEDARLHENWARALAALDPAWSPQRLALLAQVHGAEVHATHAPSGPFQVLAQADAQWTTTPGLVLAIRTADCVPILLAGPGGVAAVHSGWRSTVLDVTGAAVRALCAGLACDPAQLVAAVGPHISGAAYEVGPSVVAALIDAGLAAACTRDARGRLHVDLGAAVAAQLRAAGVGRVEQLELCTHGDPRFFSHRRDPAGGRQAALIALA